MVAGHDLERFLWNAVSTDEVEEEGERCEESLKLARKFPIELERFLTEPEHRKIFLPSISSSNIAPGAVCT